ncbi:oligosaccharide flippase family protein [Dokdonella sp.]|uniref:lipopolysaccharide biosynthesis protein n=1 Tax=Dokdonella sp. TaxID=2291710 RepID=UPI0025C58C5D|nr:oligosaccharide flippase family protein [Dokdonella sp.]MBX3692103.1 oligosaccharide flippase family protein [Dokdonella sp.]
MRKWQGPSLYGYRPGRLGQNTLYGTAGLGARAVMQAAYLLIVSRWLGADGYGLFAGSVAMVVVGAPLANWGSAFLLTRYIARNRASSRAMWATALVQTGVVGSLLALIVLVISAQLLQQRLSPTFMLLLAASELLLLPAVHAATSHCFALGRGMASAIVMCLVPLGRVLAMLGFIVMGLAGTPDHAATAHFTGSLLGFAAAAAVVATVDGWPAWRSRLPLRDAFRQGTAYAVSNAAGSSYQEADKILMLQILGAAVVGPYTIAFRIASIFLMPVAALASASLPRLMARTSDDGRAQTFRAMLLSGVGYGVLAGVAILLAGPWVPRLFGDDYALATRYLGLLALWPALFALRQCLATYLTAIHRQGARNCAEVLGLLIVVLLNLLLLPGMGGEAAVLALLASEVVVTAMMAVLVRQRHRAWNALKAGKDKHGY